MMTTQAQRDVAISSDRTKVRIALIGLAALIVTSGVNLYLNFHNTGKITQLEVNTNHKFDQLLEVTGASEYAKGQKKGAADEKARGGK